MPTSSTVHTWPKAPRFLRHPRWSSWKQWRVHRMADNVGVEESHASSRTACLLILAVSLAACTSFKVNTDHDPTVEFSSFKTFAFAGPSEMNKGGIYDNSLTRRRIESAVVRELTGKGLRQVGLDEPQDILVHYWVNIQDKQRLDSTGPTVGVARYPGGYGWGAGYGGGVTTYEYKEDRTDEKAARLEGHDRGNITRLDQ